MTLSITTISCYAECLYAEYHNLSTIMLNVIVLSVIMHSVVDPLKPPLAILIILLQFGKYIWYNDYQ